MCGLIVSTDPKTDRKDFEKGLACLNDRGPDDAKIDEQNLTRTIAKLSAMPWTAFLVIVQNSKGDR